MTTNPTPAELRAMSEAEVTQEDREAAAEDAVLIEMRDLIRAGRADHHAEPFAHHRIAAEARERADVVRWLRNGSVWLNGGECCGQKCTDGVCAAPACLWGDELNLLHATADAIEAGKHHKEPSDG